jgi:dienelactone hydrolase
LLAWAASADAAIPNSLKSACATQTPHPGYSYKFCDDGIPPSGGTTANQAGTSAVKVPAKYDGWEGLPAKSADASSMAGADNQGDVALDVDLSLPTIPAPPGGYPVIFMMHGCCSGNKTGWEATSFDAGGEKWHYNNAWFASRGYVVVTYTARGFVNGESNGNRGSTGETQLDSRLFEINDYQYLAGLLADDPDFNVNPQKVVTTGGSYGGGFSWMSLTDPVWTSPGGKSMKLAATAPKYGWTDLIYSLVPTGRHLQEPGPLPSFDGSDSTEPIGIPKKSINAALYDSGKTGIPPGSAHTTFPPYIDEALACLQSSDPFESNPICTNTINTTVPSFINDRSAYYQNEWFDRIANDPSYRIPIFNAATFTDPLFTPVENRRMANRLLETVPGYPIQEYFGDYQHFVQNKDKEWGDMCGANHHVCSFADYPGGDVNATPSGLFRTGVTTRLNRFIDHYTAPPGDASQPQPAFDVTASLQICPSNAPLENTPADEPGPTFNGPTFESLARGELVLQMSGNQQTVNNAEPNPHAASSDPVANQVGNNKQCPVENTPAGPGVATYESAPLATTQTMIGATKLSIDYAATTGSIQLNSRLYDVFPNGSAVMVDRGVRRTAPASGTVTYELHGNGWRFHAGHRVRIEIAQDDDPYLKASTVASSATISGVTLRIPTVENAPYPRPKGATPIIVSLVPAYKQCSSPNSTHGAPLAAPSCNPPVLASAFLTVGTPDANGKAAKSAGTVRLDTIVGNPSTPADEADVRIAMNLSDVRRQSDLEDYTGELQANPTLRITDKQNGPSGSDPGTTGDLAFPVIVPCSGTADTTVGATCAITTTADSVLPGVVKEGARAIWELAGLDVFDGGSDGLVSTAGNTLFARQGIFVP